MQSERKNVVILGAGFGGLRCALTLENILAEHGMQESAQIILIDKHRYHTFTPVLYEVASASPQVHDDKLYYRANILIKTILKRKNIRFIKAEVSAVDLKEQHLEFRDGGGQDFDYLVLATGAEPNFYNIPGLEKECLAMGGYRDALAIRHLLKIHGKIPRQIVVAGAGPTGVELAAELRESSGSAPVSIVLVEGKDCVLPSFPQKVVSLAAKRLKKLHIRLKCGSFITKVNKNHIILANGDNIHYDALIWTAGIRGNSLYEKLPLEREGNGMLKVNEHLHPLWENGKPVKDVYAIGDSTATYYHNGGLVPWTAQKAMEEGKKIGYTLFRVLQGLHETRYYPKKIRFIIPIGGKWAVTKLHTITHAGFFGWVLKTLVELRYLLSILPPHRALYTWARVVWTFAKND